MKELTGTASREARTVRDTELKGFAVKISKTGAVSFCIQYQDHSREPVKSRLYTLSEADFAVTDKDGKTVRLNPGDPADARRVARDIKVRLQSEAGFDPFHNRDQRLAHHEGGTIGELCDAWIAEKTRYLNRKFASVQPADERARRVGRALRGPRSLARQIAQHFKPTKRLAAIRRIDVVQLRDQIAVKHPVHAKRVVAALSVMWRYASKPLSEGGLGWLDFDAPNPARGVATGKEEPRTRWLQDDEYLAVTQALDEEPQDSPSVRAYWLLRWTGARASEVLRMRWSHINFRTQEWHRPAIEMKGGRADVLPLSEPAFKLLIEMARERKRDELFVFPGKDHGRAALARMWKRVREKAGVPDVTIHDARRTVGSMLLNENPENLYLVSQMMAHKDPSITATVYSHILAKTKRKGFDQLAAMDARLNATPALPAPDTTITTARTLDDEDEGNKAA